MIGFISYIYRFILFMIFSLFLPTAIGFALFELPGAAVGAGATVLFVLIDSLRVNQILKNELRPSKVQIAGKVIYRIEDASSHVFVTKSPWHRTPKIWVTRGSFSLLKHEDLLKIIQYASQQPAAYQLGFETYITTRILRLSKKIPASAVSLIFKSEIKKREISVSQILSSLLVFGRITFLGSLFRAPRFSNKTDADMRVALKLIQDESSFCSPELSPALSNHALVNPWPHALLYWGRSCLGN